eukprot:11969_1
MASKCKHATKEQLLSMSKEQLIEIILKHRTECVTNIHDHSHSATNNLHEKRTFSSIDDPSNDTNHSNTNDIHPPPTKKQKKAASKLRSKQKRKAKQAAAFDMNKYSQRHVAFKIAYLGGNYDGFVRQENSKNTIEETLFASLRHTCLISDINHCNYTRCGRTDKGVSSLGNVIALTVRSNCTHGKGIIPKKDETQAIRGDHDHENDEDISQEIDYVARLNSVLPNDIRILSWCPVDVDFNARFLCNHRVYKYLFYRNGMDLDAMKKATQLLIGTHDFRNFCKMDVVNVNNFVREIVDINMERMDALDGRRENEDALDELWCFNVKGSAFLWHQIRFMMTVLFMIGEGKERVDVVKYLLDVERCPGKPQFIMASDKPLILYDCLFDEKKVNFDQYAAEFRKQSIFTFCVWHQHWREHNIVSQVRQVFWRKCLTGVKDHEKEEKKDNAMDDVYAHLRQLDLPSSQKKNKRQRNQHTKLINRMKEMTYEQLVQTMNNSKREKYIKKQKQRQFYQNK